MIKISLIEAGDADRIKEMAKALADDDHAAYGEEELADFETFLLQNICNDHFLGMKTVDEETGKIVGFSTSLMLEMPFGRHKRVGIGMQLYVEPEYRYPKSRAAWLMKKASEAWAINFGATELITQTVPEKGHLYNGKNGYKLKHMIFSKEVRNGC